MSTLETQYFEGAEGNYHLHCGLAQQILEFYLVPNVYQILCQMFTHKNSYFILSHDNSVNWFLPE